jgi:hypothetical protein
MRRQGAIYAPTHAQREVRHIDRLNISRLYEDAKTSTLSTIAIPQREQRVRHDLGIVMERLGGLKLGGPMSRRWIAGRQPLLLHANTRRNISASSLIPNETAQRRFRPRPMR